MINRPFFCVSLRNAKFGNVHLLYIFSVVRVFKCSLEAASAIGSSSISGMTPPEAALVRVTGVHRPTPPPSSKA